jgi:hypothetical protein
MSSGHFSAENMPTTYAIAEMRLRGEFTALLGSVPLADCVVPAHLRWDYHEAVGLAQYTLVPITGQFSRDLPSITRSGYGCNVPEGSIVNYKGSATPNMDTMFGAGLGFNDVVVALAAAGIPEFGPLRLRIAQLQGLVTDNQRDYKRGLQGGFLWRDTLVHVWAEIARRLNINTLEIQAAENSYWWKSAKAKQGQMQRGLDGTADRMHFKQDPESKNWFISLGRTIVLPSTGEPLGVLQPPPAQAR